MTDRQDMDDILDAALDDLDDDNDEVDFPREQEEGGGNGSRPRSSNGSGDGAADEDLGRALPPAPEKRAGLAAAAADRDEEERMLAASLEDMMAQLAKVGEEMGMGGAAGEDGGGCGDTKAEKALDDLIRQMSSQMEELAASATASPLARESEKGVKSKTKASGGAKGRGAKGESVTKKDARAEPVTKKAENGASASGSSNKSAGSAPSPADGVDTAVSRLLSDMARASAEASSAGGGGGENDEMPDVPNLDAAALEGMGEDAMRSMMEEFEKFGQKGDADDVLDGMMRQLLSKDLMYEPMKQVCEKFPEWLAGAREKLPREEYERYGRQYQMFQRIVHVYETDPDNFPRLMELMQEIQEFGQPPADIVKELAPGLEFDEEGMPKMDGLGGGGMPPGMMFPPFPPGMGGGEGGEPCSIM